MELQYRLLACYLLAINVATLITFGIDKLKAKRAKWRIPEATLLMMAAVGGSVGAWAGMKLWHHKTRHKKFRYGIPVIFALQIALAGYLWLGVSLRQEKRDMSRKCHKSAIYPLLCDVFAIIFVPSLCEQSELQCFAAKDDDDVYSFKNRLEHAAMLVVSFLLSQRNTYRPVHLLM